MSKRIDLSDILDLTENTKNDICIIASIGCVTGNSDTLSCVLSEEITKAEVQAIEVEDGVMKVWVSDCELVP